MTLRHHEIAKFPEKHGVNLEWLLEGKGRIFEKDPISRLSPNMTGNEFAALVSTLPMADQEGDQGHGSRGIAGMRSMKRRRRAYRKRKLAGTAAESADSLKKYTAGLEMSCPRRRLLLGP